MDKETYEAPELTLVGDFAADTGYYGPRNGEENVWFMDIWN